MATLESLLDITRTVAAVTDERIERINGITRRSRMLALNASIEASRFGASGKGFAVVAEEVKSISSEIADLTASLQGELRGRLKILSQTGQDMAEQVRRMSGERLADMAHNIVEIADRNLYERSCDVRWWATDPAVVHCAAAPETESLRHYASTRLGVILDSYTVYLDLWVVDAQGRVIANGRPDRWPHAVGADVSAEPWFRDAMATGNGGEFSVADITRNRLLDNSVVATYSTAIRADGDADGRPIGALGIFFDWGTQGQAIVDGIRLTPDERAKSRTLIVDARHRVIAASDRRGVLAETIPLRRQADERGWYDDGRGKVVGYALTPGYETYRGLGWYGVIVQSP